jgi:signal transduction histidine kinase
MNMLVTGVALLFSSIALFAYDWLTFRENLIRELSIQAQVTGYNSVSAILFNDSEAAEKTLLALKTAPGILSAVIHTIDGQPFAQYLRDPARPPPPVPAIPADQSEVRTFGPGEIGLAQRIMSEDEHVGIVYIRTDLEELSNRMGNYIGITVVVLSISLCAALMVSTLSKRAISQPIVGLAEIARTVSLDKDYSLRATPLKRGDEISVLTDSFNDMLGQIQTRDQALEQSRADLERRVDERTAQLAAANTELEAFSYSVSHDLRAPLRHIDGFSSILAQKYGPAMEPAAQRYLGLVQESARNMATLIDDLLSMARITRQEMVRKTTDLQALLETTVRALQREVNGRSIDWRINALPTVDCDPNLIRVVLVNLLSNSVKYTRRKEPAMIEVGTITQSGKEVFYVRDNGAGFDQQYAHKLFGVFQRLHRNEDFEGTGVGLATVQRIVHRHGGRIWAEGEVDKGATFYFTLGELG